MPPLVPPLAVRLETAAAARLAAWRAALVDCRLLDAAEAHEAEVIVTDTAISPPADGPAVLSIGEQLAGDVVLPPDHLPRELATAVRLLGEILRLKRGTAPPPSEWRRLALTDPLTGLANRRAWDERLTRVRPEEIPRLALAIIDLDHFKAVNDHRGHAAGDEVLRQAAAALQTVVRSRDLLARIGGDEFGVLLFDCEPSHAVTVTERIRSSTAAVITASAGVSTGEHDLASLFAAADAALRAAKQSGDRTVGQVSNLPGSSCDRVASDDDH